MTYRLVPVESLVSDPALEELLIAVGSGLLDSGAGQAAAWHLTDGMSWETLSAKRVEYAGGAGSHPYFASAQIASARELVTWARSKAAESEQLRRSAVDDGRPRSSRPGDRVELIRGAVAK
jgi:hypothetical protein